MRLCRTAIHLKSAAARRADNLIGQRTRQFNRVVGAAAVHHHDFDATRAQRRERLQRRGDTVSFVQCGDDDR